MSGLDRMAQSTTIALFVSDVHLHASRPRTTHAFLHFLQHEASHCPALYLLGDIFEYWVGDDDLSNPEHQSILAALRALTASGVQVYWMAGNRDFLVGQAFAQACHLSLLAETHVMCWADANGQTQRLLLAHGDAQCTDDTAYMAFRAQVRQAAWQQQFLARPLPERQALVAAMRAGSKMEQQNKAEHIMDVHPQAIQELLQTHACQQMIHGHTHRPARHALQLPSGPGWRHVLPDWECDANTPEQWRGGWIALQADGQLEHIGSSRLHAI